MTEGIAVVVHDWKGEVQLQWDMNKQCSHRILCRHSLSLWCSTLVQADLSLAASPLLLSTSFWHCASLWPFSLLSIFSFQCSKPRTGEPIFPHGTCMINVWTCKLYDELALRGVTYGRNSCMMKQESWFLPKLYNENFLSDGSCVTHKSWFKMLQEGFALMQIKIAHTT